MIETRDLTKKFGDLIAVDSLTLSVKEREVFGFLGPNGAGKTTTVRMLCCLISKTSGEARIGDYEIENGGTRLRFASSSGWFQTMSASTKNSALTIIWTFTESSTTAPRHRGRRTSDAISQCSGYGTRRGIPAGAFSKGMKQKLAIARALIHDPQVLFMDEPTANLDPESTKTVRDSILELKKEKRTIFLNTHKLDEAKKICDRIAILNTRLMAIGTPAELEQSAGGRRTIVELEQLSDAVIAALRKLPIGIVSAEGRTLTLDVADPDKTNPVIVDAIGRAGGRIRSVMIEGASLEEAYLKFVRDEK